uniref:Uncharacterized protein n=1 Tax=Solanum lycopersicum TaxID=4081 RepID=K4BB45_SOLLC
MKKRHVWRNYALRSATGVQPLSLFSKSSQIGLRTLLTKSSKQDDVKLDQTNPKETMSSFGEGYATRSDEEGFGGIYGGNQEDEEKVVHGSEFDNKQGSEVKEKEKARNQSEVA